MNNTNIKSKEEILLESISHYFHNNNNIDEILPIMTGNSKISLRSIDWFVTNYSNKFKISYTLKKNNNIINFNVYNCYKNQLKAFNKRYFDPFCRINKNNNIKKIVFRYSNDKFIQTTIGQINFFKWAIENDIIKYIDENYDEIYKHMNKKENFNIKKKDTDYNFKLIL